MVIIMKKKNGKTKRLLCSLLTCALLTSGMESQAMNPDTLGNSVFAGPAYEAESDSALPETPEEASFPESAASPETETYALPESTGTPETETSALSGTDETPETEAPASPETDETPETEAPASPGTAGTPGTETEAPSEPADTPETETPACEQTDTPETETETAAPTVPAAEIPAYPEFTDVPLNDAVSADASFDLDNPYARFTTVDEETITSTADGKPKLLVFFGTNCGNSQATIRSISQYGFSDVDICAIEMQGHTKEETIAFQNTYASGSNIVFSYYTLMNNTYWNQYIDAAGIESITLPTICYIDANNRFRYITSGSCTASTIAANLNTYCNTAQTPSEKPEVDMTLTEGCLLVGFSGAYYTETAEKILDRLNAIRLEACRNGIIDPYTNKALTEADYVPLKWSSALEAITRIRAAEATISQAHTRPNGKTCFTVRTTRGEQSYAENLAWNYSGLMKGIEQWYEEKKDWVEGGDGQTGHYESIISTRFRYVAVSAFRLSSGGWYAVAQEFSDEASMDSQKDETAGNCVQYLEVLGSSVSALAFEDGIPSKIENGNSVALPLRATITYPDIYGTAQNYTGPVKEGGTWTSSDESIAAVDRTGTVTAKKPGTVTISVTAGNKTASAKLTVYESGENPLQLTPPAKTTYLKGEDLDLSGGKVTNLATGETVSMTRSMISGFHSEQAGISTVQVTKDGYTASFDTLIVETPRLSAQYGQTLSQLSLPQNDYGTWQWADGSQKIDKTGSQKFKINFIPNDPEKFQTLTNLEAEVTVSCSLEANANVTLKKDTYIYNGAYQQPEVLVSCENQILTRGRDYELTYQNNKNAGTAAVTITGTGNYQGSISKQFLILPAKLTITAKDMTILLGAPVPSEFEYEVSGLAPGESLLTEPAFTCNAPGTANAGIYDIIPGGARADDNYEAKITYYNGRLLIAEEKIAYTVTFDMQGHGAAPGQYLVKAGDTVTPPEEPTASGYLFDGWYQDTACSKAWNFKTDIVQADTVLYAKWIILSQTGFRVQEITDVSYTQKACKPVVSVYDGETLLKPNRDYKISYANNTNVNTIKKTGNGAGSSFNPNLPSVLITGKGNYSNDTLSVNFNILPAMIDDGQGNPAAGISLQYTDQLAVNKKKAVSPFRSVKYRKSMKQNVDYQISLTAAEAWDEAGNKLTAGKELENAKIPAGYTGSFELTVTGIGNYAGTIKKDIYVAESSKLLKNAKITLGKNIKTVSYTGKAIEPVPAYYDRETKKYYLVKNGIVTSEEANAADVFTVSCANTSLVCQKDFDVSYEYNKEIGKATMTITGIGAYSGSKSAAFQIKGAALKAGTVIVTPEDKTFTGKAITQNEIPLFYKGEDGNKQLVYGVDYTISYKKNINKGTAVMTFKAIDGSPYSGSFSKSFQIKAADIADAKQVTQADSMRQISVPFEKAGARPSEQVILINAAGIRLENGKDYTVSYSNNKAAAKATDPEHPAMTIKGKGNYSGILADIPFTITQGSLDGEDIIKTITPLAYHDNKAPDYVYKPSVKLKQGKSVLSAASDYEIIYEKNTQADYEAYLQKLQNGTASETDMPSVVIRPRENSNYTVASPTGEIRLPLPVYQNKLTKNKLYVVVGEAIYSGTQVTPAVSVYYSDDSSAAASVKGLTNEKDILDLGFKKLKPDTDYTLVYGANVASGANKGSVTIQGVSPYYGGSVTVKFTIRKKTLTW